MSLNGRSHARLAWDCLLREGSGRCRLCLRGSRCEYGGAVKEVSVDDKGYAFICVWGLPPYTYDDNCFRATLAALHIRRLFDAEPLNDAHVRSATRARSCARFRRASFCASLLPEAALGPAEQGRVWHVQRGPTHKKSTLAAEPAGARSYGIGVATGEVRASLQTTATRPARVT